jgi:hypothetical protein
MSLAGARTTRRLAGLGLGALLVAGAAPAVRVAAPDPAPPVAHVDAPLFRVSCDELPIKSPTPIELQVDERTTPYHALIRVFRFPGLEPLEVPIERVEVRGGENPRRVAPGEFLFTGLPLGYTAAIVLDDPDAPTVTDPPIAGLNPGPGRRRLALATRNPLVLARHAITVCDLFIPVEARLDETTPLSGVIVDRGDRRPLEGARIRCGDAIVDTDAEGRFTIAEPVSWRSLLNRTAAMKDGWRPWAVSARGLTSLQVERMRRGELLVALPRDGDERGPSLLPPLLR